MPSKLLSHCKSRPVSLVELKEIEPKEYISTYTWKPVQHSFLVESVLSALDGFLLKPTKLSQYYEKELV